MHYCFAYLNTEYSLPILEIVIGGLTFANIYAAKDMKPKGGVTYGRTYFGNAELGGGVAADSLQGESGMTSSTAAWAPTIWTAAPAPSRWRAVPTTIPTSWTQSDQFCGGGSDDIVKGVDGNDYLESGLGSDDLQGGAGGDTLHGGQGADVLEGGIGNDTLNGERDVTSNILIGSLRAWLIAVDVTAT